MLRFSISFLLVLTLVVAVCIGIVRNLLKVRQDHSQIAALEVKSDRIKSQLAYGIDSFRDRELERASEQIEKLERVAEKSREILFEYRDQYSRLKPVGPKVVSFVRLNSTPEEGRDRCYAFRVSVPKKRPVWLKFGFFEPPKDTFQSSKLGKAVDDSPFTESGPFELKLPPGEHLVECNQLGGATFRKRDVPPTIEIKVDGEVLLSTVDPDPTVIVLGDNPSTKFTQQNFSGKKRLPCLVRLNFRKSVGNDPVGPSIQTVGCSLWLDGRSSKFKQFPKP